VIANVALGGTEEIRRESFLPAMSRSGLKFVTRAFEPFDFCGFVAKRAA
jgi:hypothetical protein